jgi:hypothetical protein
MPEFVQPDPKWPPVPAPPDRVLTLAASANIVEMPADRSTVRFYHQLLQEYFAAQSMLKRDPADLTDYWRWPWRVDEMPAVGRRGEYDPLPLPPVTGWEETTVLAVELAAGRHPELLARVLAVNPVLAGRCLADTRAEVDEVTRTAVLNALLAALTDPEVSLRVRVAAGETLGRIGDPRIGEVLPVPGGTFGPDRLAYQEFGIGRYPVTNAEYRQFMDAGGYVERRWWTDAGWEFKGDRRTPDQWGEWSSAHGNAPVVGVSFYEAVAYCRWLSVQVGRTVRLPAEHEWQIAAGGPDGLLFPWGNEADPDRANLRIGDEAPNRTTPIGVYSAGASPYGLLDCAGQVWEWCLNPTTADYLLAPLTVVEPGGLEDGPLARSVRGGSWSDRVLDVAATGYREWFYAEFRSSDVGFRLAVSTD